MTFLRTRLKFYNFLFEQLYFKKIHYWWQCPQLGRSSDRWFCSQINLFITTIKLFKEFIDKSAIFGQYLKACAQAANTRSELVITS